LPLWLLRSTCDLQGSASPLVLLLAAPGSPDCGRPGPYFLGNCPHWSAAWGLRAADQCGTYRGLSLAVKPRPKPSRGPYPPSAEASTKPPTDLRAASIVINLAQPIGGLKTITLENAEPPPIAAAEVRMMMSWARDLLLAR
jgi:hypothetical protein